MVYCTADDITSDFKNQDFTAADALVTTAEVTQFIVESDALINSYVGMRFAVPITDSDALELMKLISRSLSSSRVKDILVQKTEESGGSEGKPIEVRQGLLAYTDCIKTLKSIASGERFLFGATKNVSNEGLYSENVALDIQPTFEKSTKQW